MLKTLCKPTTVQTQRANSVQLDRFVPVKKNCELPCARAALFYEKKMRTVIAM